MYYEKIKPYIEKKLISENVHPENEDVRIFNYTQHCQFEGAWDEVTVQCRGLIMNVKTGEILARPFQKFFNYQEHVAKGWVIPTSKPVVTEKLDGSLGILYWLNGKPWIATRGSFVSEQAQWATNYFRTYADRTGLTNDGWTHLFEIIYPANRIVVNYDYSDLVYLVSINTVNGFSLSIDYPFRKVKNIPNDDVQNLLKLDEPNSEGFVLFYPLENIRMKIKFPEYVRLHKIITGVSEIGIWEILKDDPKKLQELIDKVPDEFFQWVKKVSMSLISRYEDILGECFKANIMMDLEVGDTRKEKALFIQQQKYPSVMFAMLDKKDPKDIIWKMLRPHGQSQFKVDIDS